MRLPWGITVKEVYLAFFALIAIALCSFSMVLYGQYELMQRVSRNAAYQHESIRVSNLILRDVTDMESGVRGYVMSGEDRFLQPYERASAAIQGRIAELRNYTYYEPTSFAEANAWQTQVDAVQALLARQVAHVKKYGRNAAIPSAELMQEMVQMAALRASIDGRIEERRGLLQDLLGHVDQHREDFLYILIFGTVSGIGILLAGTVLIIRLEAEKEKVEEDNQRAESRFMAVMNGVNDGLYELNFVNGTMYMSREFKAMLGYAEDEMADTVEAVLATLHPDDIEGALQVRHDYVTRKVPTYSNVFRMKHKDGTWRWMLSRGIGTWDRFGQILSMVGTHTDITDQKVREEELRQLNADMEAFTYITSHDMRSPLVNLKGFSHELAIAVNEVNELIEPQKDKIGDTTAKRLDIILKHDIPEALGFIGNAVDRMDSLTTAILDLSRIGKYNYHDEVVDARQVFDKCLGAQNYEIAAKHVEITVGDLPELVTDRLALEQILSNLLDNAVKYLRPDVPGKIEVACQETPRGYVFSIRDNGRGIAVEDADRVFNIFRRARNAGDVRGLGIGMAFVKASLRRMSGTIWFESVLNEGTTFFFTLPRKSLTPQRDAGASAEVPAMSEDRT